MRISQDVRAYAAERGMDVTTAVEIGMKEKSDQFRATGAEVYLEPSATGDATSA
jgi:phosphomethylpyrimidine synthase